MKSIISTAISLALSVLITTVGLAQSQGDLIANGNYCKVFSKILNEERTLLIHMPDDYAESTKRYPVIFQLDGYEQRYLFRLAEANRALDEGLIPEFIYVAIANTDRNRDMYPFKTQYHSTGGGANNFIRFISNELIPYIDENFRTTTHRTLMGFSASGVLAFYCFLTVPETFNAYLLCSPSLSFDTDYFIDKLKNFVSKNKTMNKTLAVVYGGSEGTSYYGDQYYFDMQNCVREIINVLKSNSPKGLTWSVTPVVGGLHTPHGGVYEGLKKVFEGWQPYLQPEIIPAGGFYDFENPLPVSIKRNTDRICFTVDGSEPTKESMRYEGIFTVNKPSTIKAKIFGGKYGESATTVVEIKRSDLFGNVTADGELKNGLKYNYYEDYHFRSRLPDFNKLKVDESGTTDRINLGVKKRYEGFAVSYEGFIKIPFDGDYVFSITSNNESKLLIDSKVIIHKEFDYGLNEKTGIAPLQQGLHAIKILYVGPPFMKILGLALYVTGRGIEKQEIPAEWLFCVK